MDTLLLIAAASFGAKYPLLPFLFLFFGKETAEGRIENPLGNIVRFLK